ncbi:hypothetical protein UT300012_39680 [Paraclostridium bifermentans]
MSKEERILELIPFLKELDDADLDCVYKSAEACLIVQTIKKSKSDYNLVINNTKALSQERI